MTRALERHDAHQTLVIPVIVQPIGWTGTPIGRIQALPKNGKAITLWSNREAAWENVAEGIRKVADKLGQRVPVERVASGPSPLVISVSDTVTITEIGERGASGPSPLVSIDAGS
jgi:hypothetical protein